MGIPWSELIRLTVRADVTRSARCLVGTVSAVAFITDPDTARKILTHLRLPKELPRVAPARLDSALGFDCVDADPGDPPVRDAAGPPTSQPHPSVGALPAQLPLGVRRASTRCCCG